MGARASLMACSTTCTRKGLEELHQDTTNADDPDAEFGGIEGRRHLERRLLWKIDLRMSILVVIYILNYVRHSSLCLQIILILPSD